MDLSYLEAFVAEKLGQDTTGHDLSHIRRVEQSAITIAQKEGMSASDIITIRAAVLLHDVIDDKLTVDVETARKQVIAALQASGATDQQEVVILDTIDHMSYSKNLIEKHELTKIGQVVQDADRLDAIGAIGIGRTFYYGGSKGHAMYDDTKPVHVTELTQDSYRGSNNVVNHFYEKLLHLEGLMNTLEGKKLAKERTAFMQSFLQQLDCEIRGEK